MKTYAVLPLDDRSDLRVLTDRWRGVTMLHVREYFLGDDGGLIPGRGVAVPPVRAAALSYAIGLAARDYTPQRPRDDSIPVLAWELREAWIGAGRPDANDLGGWQQMAQIVAFMLDSTPGETLIVD